MLRQFNALARATEIIVEGTWKNLPSHPTFVAPESWPLRLKFRKLRLEKDGEKPGTYHILLSDGDRPELP